MRILVISNLYPPIAVGGYETRCAHTMRWLARRHEIVVLTSRLGRRGAPRQGDVLRELPYLHDGPVGVLRAPLASLRAVRILRRVLRTRQPDLVFVWNASGIPRAVVRVAQASGVPVAFSVADPWLGSFVEGDLFLRQLRGVGPRPPALRRAWASVARLVNRLPALRIDLDEPMAASLAWNSQALRKMTSVPRGVTPVLERVIHPATQHERLFASVARVPARTATIAFVGRIEPEKAPDVAVRALARLRDRHGIDAHLLVMGTGERAACRELEDLAAELGLEDRVQMRGKVAAEDLARALAEAHAIVVPSRWQEPFGLVCLEAALARVPIVASLSGGMPEMLKPDEEALFFAIDDVDACAAALAATLTDRPAAQERARRAREHADTYSLERYRTAYDAFVEDALHAGSQASPAAVGLDRAHDAPRP